MTATLGIPEVLRRYSGGRGEVTVEEGTVAEVLEGAFRAHPDLRERVLDARGRLHAHLLVFRNGRELDRATALRSPVAEGDCIDLIAAAEGG